MQYFYKPIMTGLLSYSEAKEMTIAELHEFNKMLEHYHPNKKKGGK